MAHFAEIDEDGIVRRVIVVNNGDTTDANGNEVESIGAEFCNKLLGGTWKQTSYNGNLRFNFAGVGYQFDEVRDAFIAPKPFESWRLDEENCGWSAPTPMPTDDKFYRWDEETLGWIERDSQATDK